MVHVMNGYDCSTAATVYVKSIRAKSLDFFDLDMVSYRTLAQQTAKSKSEVTQCRNTLLKILITDTNYLYYRRHLSKRPWEAALLAIAADR